MSTTSLVKINPGINAEKTPALNEAGWSSSQYIRWREGIPEKLGGWSALNSASSNTVMCLHAWADLNGNKWLASGCAAALNVYPNGTGAQSNITPVAIQGIGTGSTVEFTTVINSTSVTITDSTATLAGNPIAVNILIPVSVGGIVLSGLYQVNSVGTHSVTITAASAATASVTNGGAVPTFTTTSGAVIITVTLANHGLTGNSNFSVSTSTAVGGITLFGYYTVLTAGVTTNTFEIIGSVPASSSTTVSQNGGSPLYTFYAGAVPNISPGASAISASDWTLDNFGKYLVACAPGGPIYYWDPLASASIVVAKILAQGPGMCDGIVVADAQQMIIAWGCTDALGYAAVANPLQIRWCDAGDFTDWIASTTNQAGSFVLPRGSKIIRVMTSVVGILIWTDIDLWIMQYIGLPLVWGFTKVGTGCGLSSRHAAGIYGPAVYWMSNFHKFFYWSNSSGLQSLECTVWDAVFQNIKTGAVPVCGVNSDFAEISWFYPSLTATNTLNDSYVKYNADEQLWDYGAIARCAWIDHSVLGPSIGADDPIGNIWQHETSNDAGGSPLLASIQTGYFMAQEAAVAVAIDRILPDFKFAMFNSGASTATLALTVYAVMFAGDTPVAYGPFTVTSSTEFIDPSAGGLPYPRGAMFSFKISSSDAGTWWRAGNIRYRWYVDGKAD